MASMLTDADWGPVTEPGKRLCGRPRVDNRACLKGILWILRTGAGTTKPIYSSFELPKFLGETSAGSLPASYPNGLTCWRRLGDWRRAYAPLARANENAQLPEATRLKRGLRGSNITLAEKGIVPSTRHTKARGQSAWHLVDEQRISLGVYLSSLSTAEVALAETTIAQVAIPTGRHRRPPLEAAANRGRSRMHQPRRPGATPPPWYRCDRTVAPQ
jgi:hypothetical protein